MKSGQTLRRECASTLTIMLPTPAQYLLRFDDLCPTMRPERWQRFLPLLKQYSLHPILAIVPENLDHHLDVAPPDLFFMEKMRQLQADGATIALHGYQHLCESTGWSLIPLYRRSEFAGVPREIQRQWIRAGLEILRSQGLDVKIFVAPRHGFDRGTLWALRREGISILSDGMGRMAHRRGGVIWLPQQLWAPQMRRRGLWTICIHSNMASNREVDMLRKFLAQHSTQFTSVDRVLKEYPPGWRGPLESLYASAQMSRQLAVKLYKDLRRYRRLHRFF